MREDGIDKKGTENRLLYYLGWYMRLAFVTGDAIHNRLCVAL